MALYSTPARPSLLRALGPVLAALLPLLHLTLCAAPLGYLAGSPRFVARALAPDVVAQPSSLLALASTLLPLGPSSLRLALASAIALSAAAALLYRTTCNVLRAQGVGRDELLLGVALGSGSFVVALPVLFFQGARPEAFALQTALGALFVERLVHLEAAWPSHDLRPLHTAALALGLAFANDLGSAPWLLPCAMPTLARVQRAKGTVALARSLAFGVPFALLGLFGAHAVHGPLALPSLELPRRMYAALGWFAAPGALGAIAMLQAPGVRRLGVLLVLAAVAPALGPSLLGARVGAADGLGMTSHALLACGALAAALCGALLSPDAVPKRTASAGQRLTALAVLALGVLRLHETGTQLALRRFSLLEAFAGLSVHALPPRALLLVREPASLQVYDALQRLAPVRPDVALVPVSELRDASRTEPLLQRAPELRGLLRSYLLQGELDVAELQTLVAQRPVYLELDPALPRALHATLRPAHLCYEVNDARVGASEVKRALSAHREALARLSASAPAPGEDPLAAQWLDRLQVATAAYERSHEL